MDGSYFLLPVLLLTFLASLFTMDCVIVIWLVNSDRSLKKLIHNGKLVKILYWLKFEKLYPKIMRVMITRQKFLVNGLIRFINLKLFPPSFFCKKTLFFSYNEVSNFIIFIKGLKINSTPSNFIILFVSSSLFHVEKFISNFSQLINLDYWVSSFIGFLYNSNLYSL